MKRCRLVAYAVAVSIPLLLIPSSSPSKAEISYEDGVDRLVRDTSVGNAKISTNNARPIEVRGGSVYVAFYDTRTGSEHC